MNYRSMLFAGWGVLLLALSGCAETPQQAFEKSVQAAQRGEYGKVWDRFDKRSQGQLDALMQLARLPLIAKLTLSGDQTQANKIANASGRELFVLLIEDSPQIKQRIADLSASVQSASVDGDKATLTVNNNGKTEQVRMVREDDQWKIVLADS